MASMRLIKTEADILLWVYSSQNLHESKFGDLITLIPQIMVDNWTFKEIKAHFLSIRRMTFKTEWRGYYQTDHEVDDKKLKQGAEQIRINFRNLLPIPKDWMVYSPGIVVTPSNYLVSINPGYKSFDGKLIIYRPFSKQNDAPELVVWFSIAAGGYCKSYARIG